MISWNSTPRAGGGRKATAEAANVTSRYCANLPRRAMGRISGSPGNRLTWSVPTKSSGFDGRGSDLASCHREHQLLAISR